MDTLYRRQVWSGNEALLKKLEADDTPQGKARLDMRLDADGKREAIIALNDGKRDETFDPFPADAGNPMFMVFMEQNVRAMATLTGGVVISEEVGLSLAEIKGRYPNELSGGQAERVAVARALITKPSLIVADEPVSMLDASLRMSVINMFRRLKDTQGVSIVYITHDLATAFYSADRIAVMCEGHLSGILEGERATEENVMYLASSYKNAEKVLN